MSLKESVRAKKVKKSPIERKGLDSPLSALDCGVNCRCVPSGAACGEGTGTGEELAGEGQVPAPLAAEVGSGVLSTHPPEVS